MCGPLHEPAFIDAEAGYLATKAESGTWCHDCSAPAAECPHAGADQVEPENVPWPLAQARGRRLSPLAAGALFVAVVVVAYVAIAYGAEWVARGLVGWAS